MRGLVWNVVVAGGLLMAQAAGAQTVYHCRDDAGNALTLSRPCPSTMRTTAVTGGAAARPSYSPPYVRDGNVRTYSRSAIDEPDHYEYMGGRCRSLGMAMRNARSRGLKFDTVEDMQREYRRECSEEESQALRKLSGERRQQDKEQRETQQANQQQAQAAQDAERRYQEQCAESRRILQTKKARTDLTVGERGDLQRFEENFNARCKR